MSQATTRDLILNYIADFKRRNDGPPTEIQIVMGVAAANPNLSAARIKTALDELEFDKIVFRNIWGYFRTNEETTT